MCTLTYLLNDDGYEVFFNRDEQHSRPLAIVPELNNNLKAIYPVDPQGKGTWIAVNQHGLTLALLNYYQGALSPNKTPISRGLLILSLLETATDIIAQLQSMDLAVYNPFQLCIFPADLSLNSNSIQRIKWTGTQLILIDVDLPITSSSVAFDEVSLKRKSRFKNMVNANKPSASQLEAFHLSTEPLGMHSVNMLRDDAKTVSISHIRVNDAIHFKYFDNVVAKQSSITVLRTNK